MKMERPSGSTTKQHEYLPLLKVCECLSWVAMNSWFMNEEHRQWYGTAVDHRKHHPHCPKFHRVVQRRLVARWFWNRA